MNELFFIYCIVSKSFRARWKKIMILFICPYDCMKGILIYLSWPFFEYSAKGAGTHDRPQSWGDYAGLGGRETSSRRDRTLLNKREYSGMKPWAVRLEMGHPTNRISLDVIMHMKWSCWFMLDLLRQSKLPPSVLLFYIISLFCKHLLVWFALRVFLSWMGVGPGDCWTVRIGPHSIWTMLDRQVWPSFYMN